MSTTSKTSNKPPELNGPNCWGCKFFQISWDPHRPYACGFMGFRTNILPCIEVLRADGRVCQGFQAKPESSYGSAKSSGTKKSQPEQALGSRRGRPKGSLNILIE